MCQEFTACEEIVKKIISDIKTIRISKKFTQIEVAEKAGISYRTYQRIEAGESCPTIEDILKIFSVIAENSYHYFAELFSTVNTEVEKHDDFKPHIPSEAIMTSTDEVISELEILGVKKSMASYAKSNQDYLAVGYWQMNLVSNTYYWCPGMYQLYEIAPELKSVTEVLFQKINPKDIPAINEGMHQLITKGIVYRNVHSFILKNGKLRKVRSVAKICKNDKGEPVVFGIAEEIKEA